MTIVRVGTNQKYAEGWEQAFGADTSKKKPAASKAPAAKKSAKKKTAKKKTAKK